MTDGYTGADMSPGVLGGRRMDANLNAMKAAHEVDVTESVLEVHVAENALEVRATECGQEVGVVTDRHGPAVENSGLLVVVKEEKSREGDIPIVGGDAEHRHETEGVRCHGYWNVSYESATLDDVVC